MGRPLRRYLVSRYLIPAVVVASALALGAACGAVSGSDPTPTPTQIPSSPTPEPPDLTIFRGFTFPIAGACLPQTDQLMPNAPRVYRGGTHEGIDFYEYDNCTTIKKGTAIVAPKAGTIVRIDHAYSPLTPAELSAAEERIASGQANDPDVLDLFRGRQVWIDHGKGIITRYAHNGDVAANLNVGDRVAAGDVIAFVGDSGTPESISNPDSESHLHFELRAGDGYLGQGLPPDEVRTLYEHLFGVVTAP